MTRGTLATSSGDISFTLEGTTEPNQLLVLGHGAGADMDSDFMAFFADRLATEKRAVARFNFPYIEQGRRSPGTARASEEAFETVITSLAERLRPGAVVIGGKSYGGRIASHLAAAGTQVQGLVFLGYPLHAPGRPDKMRDAHLYDIEAPMLFVEGTRDPFCPLDTLRAVIAKVPGTADLVVVEDGDHSLKVRRSSGRTTEEAWSEATEDIASWLDERFPD